jgi:probable F420-dependent oxidoreductase
VSELVTATRSARIATGVIPLGRYAALDVAARYAQLQASDPARFVVGLGAAQAPRALTALNRDLDTLDRAGVPAPARLLAALGPRKLQVARERCAGAITLLVTPEFTTASRAALGGGTTLAVHQYVVLDHDAQRARAAVREPLAFLAGLNGYRANFARMGFSSDEIDGLADRLVDELAVWGDEDAVVERFAAQRRAGADHVVLSPLGGPGPIVTARRLAPALRALTT